MVSTSITPVGNQALANPSYEIEGMEGIGPQDVILPRLTIVQPTSQGKGDVPGIFHNNLTQETPETVKAVILKISRSRTLWSGDRSDKMPECSSYDGNTSKDGKNCNACEFAKWQDDPTLKSCRQGYTYLCLNTADESMFLLGAMGTSVRPAKILNSLFANKRRSPFSAIVEFATKKVEDPTKGKYWILDPKVIDWLDIARTAEYRTMYQAMQGVTINEVEPDTGAPEAVETGELPF